MNTSRYAICLMAVLLVSGLIAACGNSGGNGRSGSDTTSRETVT